MKTAKEYRQSAWKQVCENLSTFISMGFVSVIIILFTLAIFLAIDAIFIIWLIANSDLTEVYAKGLIDPVSETVAKVAVGIPTYFCCLVGFSMLGPLFLGMRTCALKVANGEHVYVADLFSGYKKSAFKSVGLTYRKYLYLTLWQFIPVVGLLKIMSFSMTHFILSEKPNLSTLEIIESSEGRMSGYKWKLFCLQFSFLGWFLLCYFTLGIFYLFVIPYYFTAEAGFYRDVFHEERPCALPEY